MPSMDSPAGDINRQEKIIEAFAGLDRITQALDGMRITNPRRVYLTVLRDGLERELEAIWLDSPYPDANAATWDETTAQMWARACSIWAPSA